LVIVVTDRQTHKPTPVKTYFLAFAEMITPGEPKWKPHIVLFYGVNNTQKQQWYFDILISNSM